MSNAAATALLAVEYLAHALMMLSAAYAAGALSGLVPGWRRRGGEQGVPRALNLLLGTAAGAGLVATALAAEAVARGRFHGLVLGWLPVWGGSLAVAGVVLLFYDRIESAVRRGTESSHHQSLACPLRDRLSLLHWVLIAASAVAALNVTIGALAPDSQQDSLWYHLSVARAWLEWDRFDAWPSVYPSNYSLLHSVLYAAMLRYGDEIHCSLLYALCGFVCYGAAAAFSRQWFGRRAAVWTWFLCATAHATHSWFAPINTGSDLVVAMFSTAGMLTALHLLFSHPASAWNPSQHQPIRALWLLSGFLIGCALATKMTTLGYIVPAWLGLCLWAVWRRPDLRWWTPAALLLTVLPFVPWAVRNGLYGCGNPLFPVAREWLPVREGWEAALRQPGHNSIFPLSLAGFMQAVEEWPRKIEYMATSRSAGFLLHAAVAAGLLTRCRLARAAGAIVVAQWGAQFWTTGFNEVARYFAQCYPIVFPVVAGAIVWFEDRAPVSRVVRVAALAALALLLGGSYAAKQVEWGAHDSIGWRYLPVLTEADKRAYLSARDCDLPNYPLYEWINAHTPRDAVILMGDIAHPFYVKRRFLWGDENLGYFGFLQKYRGVRTPADARRWLAENGIDYVVARPGRAFNTSPWVAATTPTGVQVGAPAMLLRPLPPDPSD
ncbi:MAG: hypothetical protein N2111_04480 [Candidatus Sumerlaeaceae bacterium]|nr:hypothetical protein [Candidatus Sumerlaeaceae bacterium]